MTPRSWNPYFVAYARALGRSAAAQLAHDHNTWPNGAMAPFIIWSDTARRSWALATGNSTTRDVTPDLEDSFSAWLEETYPPLPIGTRVRTETTDGRLDGLRGTVTGHCTDGAEGKLYVHIDGFPPILESSDGTTHPGLPFEPCELEVLACPEG